MSRSARTRSRALPAARRRGIPRWYVALRPASACRSGLPGAPPGPAGPGSGLAAGEIRTGRWRGQDWPLARSGLAAGEIRTGRWRDQDWPLARSGLAAGEIRTGRWRDQDWSKAVVGRSTAVAPPSAVITAPVTADAWLLARNATSAATSAGSAGLRSGTWAVASAYAASRSGSPRRAAS